MKKLIIIFVCMFVLLSNGANATDREYYKLEKGAMVFVSALHINRFVELMPSEENVAKEYFNDLLRQKLATQTEEELIVYKFDKFSIGSVDCYRIKLKNGGIVKFLNTYTGYISSIKFKDGDIVGWVFGVTLKKIKHK
jgi:hypothetical protein